MISGISMRAALLVLALCFWSPAHAHAPGPHSHTAGAAAGIAAFDLYADGSRLHLLIVNFDDPKGAPTLLHQHSRDDGRTWSDPVQVTTSRASIYRHARGNDPQIAARGDHLLAVWATRGSGHGGSGALATAASHDGGRTWRAAPPPSPSRSGAAEGYADLRASAHGFDLVWIDRRDGTHGLRHARLATDAKRWSSDLTVQEAVCECCWNALVRGEDALYVLFRGTAPRDMILSALPESGGSWERRSRVGAFGWNYKACPHTGGGLAGQHETLHAVVWTGAHKSEGLHYVRSHDGGRSWSVPHQLGSAEARRADIAASDDGVAIAWDQLEAKGRAIYAMTSHDRGERWLKPVRISAPAADAVYPRVVATSTGYLVAWTQHEGSRNVLRTHVLSSKAPR